MWTSGGIFSIVFASIITAVQGSWVDLCICDSQNNHECLTAAATTESCTCDVGQGFVELNAWHLLSCNSNTVVGGAWGTHHLPVSGRNLDSDSLLVLMEDICTFWQKKRLTRYGLVRENSKKWDLHASSMFGRCKGYLLAIGMWHSCLLACRWGHDIDYLCFSFE